MTAVASNPRPLSDTDLVEPIRDIAHAMTELFGDEFAATGLRSNTFWPLHHLERTEARHPRDLARRLGVTPATCTTLVDQLVELGYVARRTDEQDRRQIDLVVTPKGHRMLETIWREFDATLKEILADVPPEEVAVTARTVRKIADELRNRIAASAGRGRP